MATPATFPVEVEGIGTFTFKKRTLDAQFKIEAGAVRLLGGDAPSDTLYHLAITFATVQYLAVTVPDKWSIEEIDPLDKEQMDRVQTVFGRLREAENTFRAGAKG